MHCENHPFDPILLTTCTRTLGEMEAWNVPNMYFKCILQKAQIFSPFTGRSGFGACRCKVSYGEAVNTSVVGRTVPLRRASCDETWGFGE